LDPLDEEAALKRARKRCDQGLNHLCGKSLETASLSELEALGRIINRQLSKVDVKVETAT